MQTQNPSKLDLSTSHLLSAPPKAAPGAQPVQGAEEGIQAGPSGGGAGREAERGGGEKGEGEGEETLAEKEPSSFCCKVKTPRWIQACAHYRFPASIDPFTSENPNTFTLLYKRNILSQNYSEDNLYKNIQCTIFNTPHRIYSK